MKNSELNLKLAIDQIGFEYFSQCIKNGATPEEAKKEMMTESAQRIMSEAIKNLTN